VQKQTDLCLQASEHAARLSSTRDSAEWKKSREEFWMLYWGPLAVVEEAGSSSHVASEMVKFGDALKAIDPAAPSLPVEELTGASIAVAHACSDLVRSKWRVGILGWFGY
jgi:hypothetical protein